MAKPLSAVIVRTKKINLEFVKFVWQFLNMVVGHWLFAFTIFRPMLNETCTCSIKISGRSISKIIDVIFSLFCFNKLKLKPSHTRGNFIVDNKTTLKVQNRNAGFRWTRTSARGFQKTNAWLVLESKWNCELDF